MIRRALLLVQSQVVPSLFSKSSFHSGQPLAHQWSLSEYRRGAVKRDDGTAGLPVEFYGEKVIDYPSMETSSTLFNGVPYDLLPRLFIHCSKNNTKLSLWNSKNHFLGKKSCLTEGFKGSKKGTTVAAQAATLAMVKVMKLADQTTVRLVIHGLGPGRLPSVQVLEKHGINVVSITDKTDYSLVKTARPKKMRRT